MHILSSTTHFPSFCLYYIRKGGISQICENVEGSSPEDSKKVAKIKGQKTALKNRKSLVKQGFLA